MNLSPIELAMFIQREHPTVQIEVEIPLCEDGVTWTDIEIRGAFLRCRLSFSSSPAGYQCHLGDSESPFAAFVGQVGLQIFLRGLIPTMEHIANQPSRPLLLDIQP